MTTVGGQIGTDREGARRYLGCSESMFEEYTARKVIVPVRKNWYFYSDLDRAAVAIVGERDARIAQTAKLVGDAQEESNVIHLPASSRGTGKKPGTCKTPEGFVRGTARDRRS